MTIPQAAALRFRIDPRNVPADKAARVLGPTIAAFSAALPRLQNRGFPAADPDTGNYDLKAIEAWMDRRSGLADFRVCSRSTARRMVIASALLSARLHGASVSQRNRGRTDSE